MNFTFKRAAFHAEKRNNEETLEARYQWATSIANSDVEFLRNCVFIDESGFHVNLKRTGAWGLKGKTPIVEVEKTKAVSHSILGAISVFGVINTSVRMPSVTATQLVPTSAGKKRKLDSGKGKPQKPKGTTGDHFYTFLKNTMDEMDKFEYLKEAYLIMDNASIHKRQDILDLITTRKYKYIFLPPYSPELNPIEQFWSITKSKIRRAKLLDEETLQDRITEACNQVPQSHLYNIIKHSRSCLYDCLNKNPI
jgi:hypothetical protein